MIPIVPSPNVGSQLERALIAYLYEVWPVAILARPNFFFSNDWKTRVTPLLEVLAHKGTESPVHTRDLDYLVKMEAKWPGTNQPGTVNKDWNAAQINTLIGIADAALSVSDNDGQDYRVTAFAMAAAGRRLAVFGTAAVVGATADDVKNNADMVDFMCDYVKFNGPTRAMRGEKGLFLVEERDWMFRVCNLADKSIFPLLTFDGVHTLNWEFDAGAYAAPTHWVLQKSVDGIAWVVQGVLAGAVLTADITGTGVQYWRVWRSEDGVVLEVPESNAIKATAL